MTEDVSRHREPGLGECVDGDDVEIWRFCFLTPGKFDEGEVDLMTVSGARTGVAAVLNALAG